MKTLLHRFSLSCSQSAERGERDPRVGENPQRASQEFRAQSGQTDEDQGHPGARHRRQGQHHQDRLAVVHGHAQGLPHGSQSGPHISNAHMLEGDHFVSSCERYSIIILSLVFITGLPFDRKLFAHSQKLGHGESDGSRSLNATRQRLRLFILFIYIRICGLLKKCLLLF